jgi:hypothetical protein
MMDLIFGYLIVFVLLFATSISLLYRDFSLEKNKFYIFSVIGGLFAFVCVIMGQFLNLQEAIVPYLSDILFIISIIVLISLIIYLLNWRGHGNVFALNWRSLYNIHSKQNWNDGDKEYSFNKFIPLCGFILSYAIAVFSFSLGLVSSNSLLNGLELAILFIAISILVYALSKILQHAKRQYPVVIGEFMFLEFILLLIFALTFSIVRNMDYSMFSAFLILTPTYQVMYMLLALAVLLVLGVLINTEYTSKKLERK